MASNGTRPFRVVIVGSGPSGFYAAEALLKDASVRVEVDMLDRLPVPYGLVRGGVAPDHQKIKGVIKVYEKTASYPRFRFYGNVKVGADLSVDDLRRLYDAVVLAVGAEGDHHMDIPGEGLPGSHAATEFVGWYNGHPDYHDRRFDLSCESVAVVGIGNVAMDVTRILASDPEELAKTDMADYAVEALRASRVKDIWLLGRRGPVQAAFSPAEITELGELSSADLVVRPEDVALDEASREDLARADASAKKNVEFLQKAAARGEGSRGRKVRLRFCVSPVELIGEGGRVGAARLERNALKRDAKGAVKARGTGEFETVKVGLVLRSVGYFGVPLPGVAFDTERGVFPNAGGRLLESAGGPVICGEYVVGWAKRGPSGLIGTNRACSTETAARILEDLKAGLAPGRGAAEAEAFLRSRKADLVSFADWKRLDALELSRGQAAGKIREKFTTVGSALEALKTARI
ncbi:MAG: FAD-dependent oxidoreductase [Elusimicrobia bacterium]|nr:FAD-dependent oxidoreductase [Elusimicrobiota bacterium]